MDIMSSLGWYIAVILPTFIFQEANDMMADFLKEKKIYDGWDSWHGGLVLLIILYFVMSLVLNQ
jgi:hypothetical protein